VEHDENERLKPGPSIRGQSPTAICREALLDRWLLVAEAVAIGAEVLIKNGLVGLGLSWRFRAQSLVRMS